MPSQAPAAATVPTSNSAADHASYAERAEATVALIALRSACQVEPMPKASPERKTLVTAMPVNEPVLPPAATTAAMPVRSPPATEAPVIAMPARHVQCSPALMPSGSMPTMAAPTPSLVQAKAVPMTKSEQRPSAAPTVKHGWTPEEDNTVLQMVRVAGPKWSQIAMLLPGRSDDSVRNRFLRLQRKWPLREQMHRICTPQTTKKGDMWSAEEDAKIEHAVNVYGLQWQQVASVVPGRSVNAVRNRYLRRTALENLHAAQHMQQQPCAMPYPYEDRRPYEEPQMYPWMGMPAQHCAYNMNMYTHHHVHQIMPQHQQHHPHMMSADVM